KGTGKEDLHCTQLAGEPVPFLSEGKGIGKEDLHCAQLAGEPVLFLSGGLRACLLGAGAHIRERRTSPLPHPLGDLDAWNVGSECFCYLPALPRKECRGFPLVSRSPECCSETTFPECSLSAL